jgi:hypothetical protein
MPMPRSRLGALVRCSPHPARRQPDTVAAAPGYIEAFNSRVRDECLSINMFWSLAQGGW